MTTDPTEIPSLTRREIIVLLRAESDLRLGLVSPPWVVRRMRELLRRYGVRAEQEDSP